jgi:hypothetical protein
MMIENGLDQRKGASRNKGGNLFGWRHLLEEDQVQVIELEHVYVFLASFYLFYVVGFSPVRGTG